MYRGIEKMEVDGVVKDYIKIEYAGKSNHVYSRYPAGCPAKSMPVLMRQDTEVNKLGGQEWKKTKTKVRGAVKNIAKDLVALYAARQQEAGFRYGPDTVWQREI